MSLFRLCCYQQSKLKLRNNATRRQIRFIQRRLEEIGQCRGPLLCNLCCSKNLSQSGMEMSAGRPRANWLRTAEKDVVPLYFGLHTARRNAQNHITWSCIVNTAMLHQDARHWRWCLKAPPRHTEIDPHITQRASGSHSTQNLNHISHFCTMQPHDRQND